MYGFRISILNLTPMARQAGPLYFTGTLDDLTFYKMEGVYYARKKSSLDRKRFRTDPRFKRSRASAATFGVASRLASQVYQLLPKEHKGKGVIGKLTSQVGKMLKEGRSSEEILEHFQLQYTPVTARLAAQNKTKETANVDAPLSTWKITASGKLISKQTEKILNHNSNQAAGCVYKLTNSIVSLQKCYKE